MTNSSAGVDVSKLESEALLVNFIKVSVQAEEVYDLRMPLSKSKTGR